MLDAAMGKGNVGKIAERIVANELEYRGFLVSDLNRDRTSANADLIAVGHNKVWQVQVKGATNTPANVDGNRWWVGYGYSSQEQIDSKIPHFNTKSSAYKADCVVFVAVNSPSNYKCIVMPIACAEPHESPHFFLTLV